MTRPALALLSAAALSVPGGAWGGEVRGTARLEGPVPAAAPMEATKEKAVCGETVPDDSIQVANGRLRNVVVIVKGAPAPAPGTAVLDQKTCRFVPHVQAVAVGSTLDIVNGDPTLHNVHGYLGQATAFNVALPGKDQRVPRKLARPGIVAVRCDVHAWMSAYVVVADAPFAVTGEDGSFVVPGVPPGTWTVTAWHEKLGERTATVTVPPTGAATVEFSFGK